MPRDENNRLKNSAEEMLARAKHPEASGNLLSLLFPKLGQLLGTNLPFVKEEGGTRIRRHRISQREFARTYFALTPDAASWGRQELENILNMEPNKALQIVDDRVNKAPKEDQPILRRQFLDALEGALGAERVFTGEWLRSLVDFSLPYLRAGDLTPSLLYYTDNFQRFRTAIFAALNAQEPSSRAAVFAYAAEHARELSLLCSTFRTAVGDKNPSGVKTRSADFFGTRVEEIRTLLLDRVRRLAKAGLFWSQAFPADLLWFWYGSDFANEVRDFVARALDQAEGFRAMLTVTVHRVYSTSGDYDSVNPEWSKIVDLELLETKARYVSRSDTGADLDRRLAEVFLLALENGRNDPFWRE